MKIAIVAGPLVPVPPPKYGGTERVISHLIDGLQELGHEVVLIAPGDSTVNCPIIPSVDKAIWFPRLKGEVEKYKEIEAIAIEATLRIVDTIKNDVDIIHSHGLDLLRFNETANATTIHGPLTFEQIPYYNNRKSLPYICISENQKKIMPTLNVAGVVYNGLNPDEFPFVEKPDNYVVFIGRFDREKNPHLAIKLALALNIPIKLAGKIDYLGDGYFEEEISPHLSNPLVEYVGEVGLDEKIELMSHAICNFHPTGFREPFGLTVLESAYCGTPTLAISMGSMPELIIDGKTGVLVEDFVEGYGAFDVCKSLDRTFISEYSRAKFNYKQMATDYVGIYEKVITNHNRLTNRILRKTRRWFDSFKPKTKTTKNS